MCKRAPEDRIHFLVECQPLQDIRDAAFQKIRGLSDSPNFVDKLHIIMQSEKEKAMLLLNPQHHKLLTDVLPEEKWDVLERCITSACYMMHVRRWNLLGSLQKNA